MPQQYSLSPQVRTPLTLSQRENIVLHIRHPLAQSYALDAIVQLGISEGELTPDQLENLSVLTRRLFDDLEKLAAFVDDLGIIDHPGGQHE